MTSIHGSEEKFLKKIRVFLGGYSIVVLCLILFPWPKQLISFVPYKYRISEEVLHGFTFGILVILLFLSKIDPFLKNDQSSWKSVIRISLFVFLIGVLIEIIQEFLVANRYASLDDLIANFLGVVLGGGICCLGSLFQQRYYKFVRASRKLT